MFRIPKLPEKQQLEFDPELFEKERIWLELRANGKLQSSVTPSTWWSSILPSSIIAFFVGGSIGALFGAFFRNANILIYSPLIVFVISLLILNKKYALIELDVETKNMLYEGLVSFGGEDRIIRYMGPIEVIEGTQLVKHHRFRRTFIRFLTKSGYLKVLYKPEKEKDFLQAIEMMGLIDLLSAEESLQRKKPIKRINEWDVYYEETFDRTEFINKLKKEREEKERMNELERKKRREELVARSKERRRQESAREEKNVE